MEMFRVVVLAQQVRRQEETVILGMARGRDFVLHKEDEACHKWW